MILKHNQSSTLASELADSMHNSLNNLINNSTDENINKTINDLVRSAELFDELQNYKAAEIITKVIEKLASKNGK